MSYFNVIARVVVIGAFAAFICGATDLSGLILDDQGQPVAGASVTVARSSVDGPLRAAEAYPATTASDGTYTVKGLSAGPFIVCAWASGRALLDPCQWGSPAVVRLASGVATASATTQLQLGATISIRVDDPSSVLFAAATPGKAVAFLQPGVWPADGHFHSALHVSSDATGHNFQLVVAPNTALALAIASENVSVLDATSNSPVSSAQRVSVNLTPGATLQLHYVASPTAAAASPSSGN